MKRAVSFSLAALASVFLLSSCYYDPLYSGSWGGGYSSYSAYSGPYGYSGGYYNGFYSDFYVGYYDNYYRYRHTRCSVCNYYPCRGGHHARYHTYYRNYNRPIYNRSHRGHDQGRQHATYRGQGSHRDYDGRSSDSRRYSGEQRKQLDGYGSTLYRNSSSDPRRYSSPNVRGSSGFGTMRNTSGYSSSPRFSNPSGNSSQRSGDSGRSRSASPRPPSPHSITSAPPRAVSRVPVTANNKQPSPSSASSSSSSPQKSFSPQGGGGRSGGGGGSGGRSGRKAGQRR